jgi:hypothetical protein
MAKVHSSAILGEGNSLRAGAYGGISIQVKGVSGGVLDVSDVDLAEVTL